MLNFNDMNNKRASFNLDETIDIALVENVSRNSELVNYKAKIIK